MMNSRQKFRALTPNESIDLHNYKEAIDYVFSREDIRNIALSGSYGSGKSSVMRSYENIHKEHKFIHISLSHFEERGWPERENDITQKDSTKKDVESEEKRRGQSRREIDPVKTVNDLEGKILNQLLHQIPPKNIPQSHFRIKDEISKLRRIISVALILLFVSLLIYVICFHSWCSMIDGLSFNSLKRILLFTANQDMRLFCMLLVTALSGMGLFYFMRNHNFQNIFKKIDVKGIVGIEVFETNNDSYFDKYLNEVLYIFERSGADAIVFEDLDRYDVTLIFEKLREINDLVYSKVKRDSEKIGDSLRKPLRFFYLIRDDIFTSSDRSKFFDFIIPVVPYVDSSNSCDQFLELFEKSGLGNAFSKRFLQDVSLYLSDMRLITNIVNEYIVYSGRLKDSGLKTKGEKTFSERQLAMIIYKNLYPSDFSLLQKGQGYVFGLINRRQFLIDALSVQLNESMNRIRQEIEESEHEQLSDIDELNALFFPLLERIQSIAGKAVSNGIGRIELIKQILLYPEETKYYRVDAYNGVGQLDVEARRQIMESDPDYARRKEIIQNRETSRRISLESELEKLEQKKLHLFTMNLAELLDQADKNTEEGFWKCELPSYEPSNYIFQIQNSRGYSLLKYLIRNGFIDENYAAYISYFYPNSLTIQDKNFLLALSDHSPLPPEYRLDRPGDVLERLSSSDFIRKELQNYDFLAYLLHSDLKKELQNWMNICNEKRDFFQFLVDFWRTGRERKSFVCIMFVINPSLFFSWNEQGLLYGSEWRLLTQDAFEYLNSDQLIEINRNGWLSDNISSDSGFLRIDKPDVQKIILGLKTINVRFIRIDYREQDLPLVNAVYQENLYEFNFAMLKTFLKMCWSLPDDEMESRSYTYLHNDLSAPLSVRAHESIEEYVSVILSESDARFADDEDAVVDLLNNESLSEKSRLDYIQRMDTVIMDINSIENHSLWTELILHQRIQYSWQNIVDYFADLGDDIISISSELASFLNSDMKPLDWHYPALKERIGEEKAYHFLQAILCSTNLTLDHYRNALAGFRFRYDQQFPFSDISDDRMMVLFELQIITMTAENVSAIRENYPHLWKDFALLCGLTKLLDLVNNQKVELAEEELVAILEDPGTTLETALGLLDAYSGTIPLKGHEYSPHIKAAIITMHLDEKEVPDLLREFDNADSMVNEAILQYAKNHPSNVVESAKNIGDISERFFAALIDVITTEDSRILLPYLNNKDFLAACNDTGAKTIALSPENLRILDYFKTNHWISSYSVKDEIIKVNPTRKKK